MTCAHTRIIAVSDGQAIPNTCAACTQVFPHKTNQRGRPRAKNAHPCPRCAGTRLETVTVYGRPLKRCAGCKHIFEGGK